MVSSFTLGDPGPVDATINWGDGQFSSGNVQPNGHGGYDVLGSHTYNNVDGTFAVRVTVTETSTVNGGVRIDFPVRVQGRLDRELSTDLGMGGPTVRAVTTNGGVQIKRR